MGRNGIYLVSIFGILALTFIFYSTTSQSSQILSPSELVEAEDLKRIRVAGKVADAEINYEVTPKLLLKFSMVDREGNETKHISVQYRGVRPDMFQQGREVFIDGDYINGILNAATLQTQCPSKYEGAKPPTSSDGNK